MFHNMIWLDHKGFYTMILQFIYIKTNNATVLRPPAYLYMHFKVLIL